MSVTIKAVSYTHLSSILCTYRDAGRKKSPGGSTLWGEKHRRSSGLNGAAEKSGIRTKPVMGSSYGHIDVYKRQVL